MRNFAPNNYSNYNTVIAVFTFIQEKCKFYLKNNFEVTHQSPPTINKNKYGKQHR